MWRKNVCRLRHCPSTTIRRDAVIIRRYSSENSSIISESEFESALGDVLLQRWNPSQRAPLGFAISGGVDSMALAALYARAQRVNASLPHAHCFIVDHKVRPESTEEAKWVREQLQKQFNMEASILTINWPEISVKLDVNRFETQARTLRYQALGRACRDKNITAMMVAHHGDDQAETVLMRLARNRLRTGLAAIRKIGWIPECEGIYGVHHSGKVQDPGLSLSTPFPVEQGGIQILRPLLSFEKTRLVTTCQELGVEWAEDNTNSLPTLTSRNAIRHIYRNHKVPGALSIKSLIETSRKMSLRVDNHKAFADQLLDQCPIKLDIQTSSLLIRFPPFCALLKRQILSGSDKHEAWNNAYYLMDRVTTLVTPTYTATSNSQLSNKITDIYPEFLTAEEDTDMTAIRPKGSDRNFTVHGVWWQKWEDISPFDGPWLLDHEADGTSPHPKEWLLIRQNLSKLAARYPNMQVKFPPSRDLSLQPTASPDSRNTFQLVDGRWWIKVLNHTRDDLVVRIFHEDDMRHLPKMRFEHIQTHDRTGKVIPGRFMTTAMHLLKPTMLRFTIPAVFRVDKDTGAESLVGFPTLNISMHGFGAPGKVCDWFVRYKKIDFGKREPGDIIVPGLEKTDYAEEIPWWLLAKKTGKSKNRRARGARAKQKREIEEPHVP